MRKFDDLSDLDKGAYIVTKAIMLALKKADDDQEGKTFYTNSYECGYLEALIHCVNICNECLDIETLGEIE